MFQLKPLSRESLSRALEKAERYRLLNEPEEAESICLDILEVDPENRKALVVLLLAITDQFQKKLSERYERSLQLLSRLQDAYEQSYYEGILCERRAKAHLQRGVPGSGSMAYHWLRKAMNCYEQAEQLRPSGNDDAILRWNTCARTILGQKLEPGDEETFEPMLE